jgi:hypothetical protein
MRQKENPQDKYPPDRNQNRSGRTIVSSHLWVLGRQRGDRILKDREKQMLIGVIKLIIR